VGVLTVTQNHLCQTDPIIRVSSVKFDKIIEKENKELLNTTATPSKPDRAAPDRKINAMNERLRQFDKDVLDKVFARMRANRANPSK